MHNYHYNETTKYIFPNPSKTSQKSLAGGICCQMTPNLSVFPSRGAQNIMYSISNLLLPLITIIFLAYKSNIVRRLRHHPRAVFSSNPRRWASGVLTDGMNRQCSSGVYHSTRNPAILGQSQKWKNVILNVNIYWAHRDKWISAGSQEW
ncbi:hypothetical protein XELAEV_18028703mg [Xenopus laevis]|uniref:Uncharacterized protein n=1 Tax=Xenopus laevis TaxID=8355 RepID=A0A974HHF7_XENLA|nr:hypothetical protein XELAEV_18028703mg [Xenopus laevis]